MLKMMRCLKSSVSVLTAILATTAVAFGASETPDAPLSSDTSHSSDVVHEDTHSSHPHHLGVSFGGATRFEDDHTSTGMSIGLDYEYRFDPQWAVGVVLETVVFDDDHRDLAFAVPIYWNPVEGLSFGAGPGFETDGGHTSFMARFSVSYSFHLGEFSVAPIFAVDLADGAQTLVYGFSIGRSF